MRRIKRTTRTAPLILFQTVEGMDSFYQATRATVPEVASHAGQRGEHISNQTAAQLDPSERFNEVQILRLQLLEQASAMSLVKLAGP